ncbi:restriction endonuclease subunit S [Micromonospora sp. CPCC 205556]|uniref:restriction endonuclease subunit S n=1 Tax=Micromonospora sp. CPCC 205556 TaxID=3122398 RepID=UPI002FEF8672
MTSVPSGWRVTPLETVATVRPGRTPRSLDRYLAENPRPDRIIPFFKVGDMNDHASDLREARTYLAADELQLLGLATVPVDTIVFPKAGGAIATNKKRRMAIPGVIDLNCMAIVPSEQVDPRYLRLWFESFNLASIADGSVLPQISKKRVSALPVPLPPPNEQRQLVDILEDHLSRLDAANGLMSSTQRRLAAYEASALSRCRDGDERPLYEVTLVQGGIQKQHKRTPQNNAYPFLRVANVTKYGLDLHDVHRIELFSGELARLRLQPGDLLVVEGNGSPSQIGRAALWDGSIEDCVHQNHLIRVRPTNELDSAYLEAVWNSPQNRQRLTELASSSSGLHTLSVSKLKSLFMPVPPLARQRELVEALTEVRERRYRLGAEMSAVRAKAERLRHATLVAAFSGQLTGRSRDMQIVEEMAGV